jgi:hypothetical protein
VVIGPGQLRQQVIDHIQATDAQQPAEIATGLRAAGVT